MGFPHPGSNTKVFSNRNWISRNFSLWRAEVERARDRKCRLGVISPREESPEALFAVLGSLRSPFRELENASQFHKRHPGEVSMPLHVLAQRGNHVNVDVETDGFWELLQAEHIDMTALTWRESRCRFNSSARKARASRLQRTRPARPAGPGRSCSGLDLAVSGVGGKSRHGPLRAPRSQGTVTALGRGAQRLARQRGATLSMRPR